MLIKLTSFVFYNNKYSHFVGVLKKNTLFERGLFLDVGKLVVCLYTYSIESLTKNITDTYVINLFV